MVLNELIKIYEAKDYQLCCYGARFDVHTSGLGNSMSLGKKGYVLKMNQPVAKKDLVNIFEYSNTNIGSLYEKKEYYKKWLKSFGFTSCN